MTHSINPLVDCVFKAILGRDENKELLIHFLNAVLKPEPEHRIHEVDILNPFNYRLYTEDKLTIVDVKASDQRGNYYQVEIQLSTTPALAPRMLYTWSSIYHAMIEKGAPFSRLKPLISIWILKENLFSNIDNYHLEFVVYNIENKLLLTDHMAIHVLQLPQWDWTGKLQDELDRWMYTFKEGEKVDLEHPPEILQTKEMEKVMDVMKQFSENKMDYFMYENRRLAQMQENTINEWKEKIYTELEEANTKLEAAKKETAAKTALLESQNAELESKNAELESKEAELDRERQEKEELKKMLKKMGIDPNQL